MVEREGQVQEDDLQQCLCIILILEAIVDERNCPSGEKQCKQRQESLARALQVAKGRLWFLLVSRVAFNCPCAVGSWGVFTLGKRERGKSKREVEEKG